VEQSLGGDHVIFLIDMVETKEEALSKKVKLKVLPMQLGNVDRACVNLT